DRAPPARTPGRADRHRRGRPRPQRAWLHRPRPGRRRRPPLRDQVAMWSTLSDHPEVVYGAVLALVIVILLTPAVGGMARMLGVVDEPGARRLNRRAVPRLGGLALFFGIFVPALAFLPLGSETRGLLLGAAVATTVGAIDDFRGLVWWEKLGGQVAAAAIATGFGIWVHRFTFPVLGVHALPEWVGIPLTILWIVAKRLKSRQPVYGADRSHLHHRFMNIGFSQPRAALTMWAWCGILAAAALATRFLKPHAHGVWHTGPTVAIAAIGALALAASI